MSIYLERRCLRVLLVIPVTVVVSALMGDGGCRWNISISSVQSLVVSLALCNNSLTSALVAKEMTFLKM